MRTEKLIFQTGYSDSCDSLPAEMYPAVVPGAVQLDYARAKNWPPFWKDTEYKNYRWMEDVYWCYKAPLSFSLADDECANLIFKGIDYRYRICVNDDILCEGEGMFSAVRCDVSAYADTESTLYVWIWPAPKADDSDSRSQASESCKVCACYGWDWHPRLISAGLWDDVDLVVHKKTHIISLEASYTLSQDFSSAVLKAETPVSGSCRVLFSLLDGENVVSSALCSSCRISASEYIACAEMTISFPKLWYPAGYGEQPLYTLTAQIMDEDMFDTEAVSRRIGFKRSRLVMNQDSWDQPSDFPKSRSDAPAALQVNGLNVFAKGSNWVNAQVFPGDMNAEHYDKILTLVAEANMNILRIWGGGFVNKESFFDLCDEKGIMVWQEFPLACNEYPDDDKYLSVLEKEAVSIVRRLRTHPCLTIWCGGNELFNSWSKMTDQHHALRLLDKICYEQDRFTPFIMTSPLNGMAHGHYVNYDEQDGEEFLTVLSRSRNTAYTEFGAPGCADPSYIRQFMSEKDFQDCRPENEIWKDHHAFDAWTTLTWLRIPEVEYYFGGYSSMDDLCHKTQFIQAMGYKSLFEEMRRQQPHCSMALNWCLNEPWPTAANNSLISWPDIPRPAYEAVKQALRPQMSSLAVSHNLWKAGELFTAGVWMLNESLQPLDSCSIDVFYSFPDLECPKNIFWGSLHTLALPAQRNQESGAVSFPLPEGYNGRIFVQLQVKNAPELSSEYILLCRSKKKVLPTNRLNQ